MKAINRAWRIVVVGLGVAALSSPMTWDGPSNTFMTPRVEAQTKLPLFKPPLRGAPARRMGAGTRSDGDTTHALFALVPKRVEGLTLQNQPSLYWYLSRDTMTHPVEVTLTQGKGITSAIVTEFQLDPPLQAGIHRIRLDQRNVSLEPGKRYQWTVALIRDPNDRSQDVVSGGIIKRVEPGDLEAAEREQLKRLSRQQDQKEKLHIYLSAGIWYDGVSVLSDLIDASPQDTHLRELRASLCEQKEINLMTVASYDRQHQ